MPSGYKLDLQDRDSVIKYISERIKINENGCWEWQKSITRQGYGNFRKGGRIHLSHRVAFEIYVGRIPDGLQIDHLCRNRSCCNPDHLEAVTQRQFILRGESWAGKHARKTHCPHGHEYTEENTYWRKTPSGVGRMCRTCRKQRNAARYPNTENEMCGGTYRPAGEHA